MTGNELDIKAHTEYFRDEVDCHRLREKGSQSNWPGDKDNPNVLADLDDVADFVRNQEGARAAARKLEEIKQDYQSEEIEEYVFESGEVYELE